MPLDNTTVIPAGWSQHHAPTAAGGMNATVQVHNPAAATTGWNPVTESQDSVPGPPVYDGPARVQEYMRATLTEQTGQSVSQRRYRIQLLFDAPHVEEGWTVTVTAAVNDTDLIAWTATRPLVIEDVQHGSERFTRDLVATINLD